MEELRDEPGKNRVFISIINTGPFRVYIPVVSVFLRVLCASAVALSDSPFGEHA
jgi:hypothetical protein